RGRRLAHDPRHRADRHRFAHGRRDLRGVQGHRQQRDPPRPPHRRKARLPGEFKGTGNSEIHLDRRIAEKRVYPAFNINRSGTRREELITSSDELQKIWILRKLLHPMDELAAAEFLIDKMRDTKTNGEFFEAMKR
ncbi:MAG: rho, partial [Steroidobacteraceae bacterium]|nr:rho [Steroidobacteraceae bacterium]